MKIFSGFDDVDVDEKRMTKTKTKDERRKTSIEKEQKKEKYFQNKRACVRAPQLTFFRRPFCLPYLATAGCRHQAGPAAFYNELPKQWERVINYRKCPTKERTNVKRKTGDFQSSD
jgi:hypothetical protein